MLGLDLEAAETMGNKDLQGVVLIHRVDQSRFIVVRM